MSNFAVGLIGGIASGKTLACDSFEALGVECIDTDKISRALVEPGMPTLDVIIDHFGKSFLTSSGALNRSRLKERIFADQKARVWLEALMHPKIREEVKVAIKSARGIYCVVAIPLLQRREDYPELTRIFYLETPRPLQLERLMSRDKMSKTLAEKIIAAQPSISQYRLLADTIIVNDTTQEDLVKKIEIFNLQMKFEFEKQTKSL